MLISPVARPYRDQTVIYSGSGFTIPFDFFGCSTMFYPVYNTTAVGINYSFNRTCSPGGSEKIVWANVNTAEDVYDWTDLDTVMNYVVTRDGHDYLCMPAFPAAWAAARPGEINGQGYCPCEPSNMLYWKKWIQALCTRYPQIRYWEVWNEPQFTAGGGYFSGTYAKLAEMARVMSQIVKASNPLNKVMGTSQAGLASNNLDRLESFLDADASGYDAGYGTGAGTHGSDWLDIISMHAYTTGGSDVAISDALIVAYQDWVSRMTNRGITKDKWITEFGNVTWATNAQEEKCREVVRRFVVAAAFNVKRFIWFAYDNSAGSPANNFYNNANLRDWWNNMVKNLAGKRVVRLVKTTADTLAMEFSDGSGMHI